MLPLRIRARHVTPQNSPLESVVFIPQNRQVTRHNSIVGGRGHGGEPMGLDELHDSVAIVDPIERRDIHAWETLAVALQLTQAAVAIGTSHEYSGSPRDLETKRTQTPCPVCREHG